MTRLQRLCWLMYDVVLHPRSTLLWQLKWRNRPGIGTTVDYHGKIQKVVAFGESQDDLILEDGSHASWLSCCGYPTEKEVEEGMEK